MARRPLKLEQLPSNNITTSNRKDVDIVTTGRIKTKKGGGFANDVWNVGNSLFAEIILPAIRSAVVDFISNGAQMIIFGEDNIGPRKGRHTSYSRMYNKRRPARDRRESFRNIRRTEEVFEDIYFDNRRDAETVLGRMMELIAEYRWATVGDLYSLVGLSTNYTHERYGWEDLRGCRVQFTSDGYVVDFPEPEYLQ